MKARLCGTAFWTPGFGSAAAWLAGERAEGLDSPKASILPSRLRRRTALLTKAVCDVVEDVAGRAEVDLATVRLVLVTAWGEFETTLQLLEQLAAETPEVSPTLFHNSVYNTATGYLSIVLENREGSTAIGAGEEGLAAGLVEAISLVATEGEEVVLVVADEAVPPPFEDAPGDPVAFALCLRPAEAAAKGELDVVCELGHGDYAECSWTDLDVPRALATNPARSVVALAKAIAGGQAHRVPLSLGSKSGWFLELQPQEGV